MKRHISIVAIALMAVAVAFVGCKKDPKPTPTPQKPTAPTVAFVEGTDELGEPYLVEGTEVNLASNRLVGCKVTCGDTKGVIVKLTGMFGTEEAFAPKEKQFVNDQCQTFNVIFNKGGDCVLTLTATDSYGQTAEKKINVKVIEFDDAPYLGSFACADGKVECYIIKDGVQYSSEKAVESAVVVSKTATGTYKCQLTIDGRTFETEGTVLGNHIDFNCIDLEVPIGDNGIATVNCTSMGFSRYSDGGMHFKAFFENENGIPGTNVTKVTSGFYNGTMVKQ